MVQKLLRILVFVIRATARDVTVMPGNVRITYWRDAMSVHIGRFKVSVVGMSRTHEFQLEVVTGFPSTLSSKRYKNLPQD